MAKASPRAAIIGVPLDAGGAQRGASGGPAAIRRADLLRRLSEAGRSVRDLGDVSVPDLKSFRVGHARKRYADLIRKVCAELCETTAGALRAKDVPVILGGDHSLAMGSVAGVAKHFRAKGKKIGMIYLDAHGDMNVPATSPSGNVHGMPVAHLLGMGDQRLAKVGGFAPKVEARNTVLIGLRDLDEEEKKVIRSSGVRTFTMKDIDRHGIGKVFETAVRYACEGTAGYHLSFDIDVVDPSVASGTGTPSRGGLTYREAQYMMELASDSGRMLSMDLVEVNPLEDTQNRTAELACELILSALGKSIL